MVGGGHLRPALPAPDEPGRSRPSSQPGDPGPLGSRFHLQARDRDRGAERRPARQPRRLHRRPRLLPDRAALQRTVHLLQQPERERPGADRRDDGAHRSPTTCSSTPSGPTTGTTRRPTARRPSKTSPSSTASGSSPGSTSPTSTPARSTARELRQVQHAEAPQAFPSTYYGIADNIEMAFGQGETLVTPLQEAVAYGTFATGGTRYAPQVVNSIVSPTGKVVKQFKPRVMGHVALPASTYAPDPGRPRGRHLLPRTGPPMARSRATTGCRSPARPGRPPRARTPTCSRRPGSSPSGRRPSDAALCRRRRDRSGGLRRGSRSPGGAADLHLPDQPPGRFRRPPPSVERSLTGSSAGLRLEHVTQPGKREVALTIVARADQGD